MRQIFYENESMFRYIPMKKMESEASCEDNG